MFVSVFDNNIYQQIYMERFGLENESVSFISFKRDIIQFNDNYHHLEHRLEHLMFDANHRDHK